MHEFLPRHEEDREFGRRAKDHDIDRASACGMTGLESVHLDLHIREEGGQIDRILQGHPDEVHPIEWTHVVRVHECLPKLRHRYVQSGREMVEELESEAV